MFREELTRAVHDNLRNLGLDLLDLVNLRSMLRDDAPADARRSSAPPKARASAG
jgi:pyridoxine 4-dehydrogenase